MYAFEENHKQRHLWRISVADRTEQRLTDGDLSVLDYDLSHDGTKVVVPPRAQSALRVRATRARFG